MGSGVVAQAAGGIKGGGLPLHTLNWETDENFCSYRKIFVENAKFGAKAQILGKFRRKIEIFSTHNVFCRKIATSCPASFLNSVTQDAAGYKDWKNDMNDRANEICTTP